MSREEAIDIIKCLAWHTRPNEEDIEQAIKALEKEPKTGHWFVDERPESNREVICSNCEQSVFKYHKLDFDYRPMYCPNCGARMFEPQESEVNNG